MSVQYKVGVDAGDVIRLHGNPDEGEFIKQRVDRGWPETWEAKLGNDYFTVTAKGNRWRVQYSHRPKDVEGTDFGGTYETKELAMDAARRHADSMRPRGNPEYHETHALWTLVHEGAARALWVTSWADWLDDQSPAKRKRLGPGGGEDWNDYAPETPRSAKQAAERLLWLVSEANGQAVTTLLKDAANADLRKHKQAMTLKIADSYADSFGHCLAMQALGHGVSWFDDHAQFPLKVPRFEAHTVSGRTLEWSPR